jgi:hypothetical protein
MNVGVTRSYIPEDGNIRTVVYLEVYEALSHCTPIVYPVPDGSTRSENLMISIITKVGFIALPVSKYNNDFFHCPGISHLFQVALTSNVPRKNLINS